MKPRIIVEISGGVCVAVYADRPVNVDVLDHDNIKSGEMEPEDLSSYLKLTEEIKKLEAYF